MANPPQKEASRGSLIVVGLIALAGAVVCGRLLFVRHDSAPTVAAPGAAPETTMVENAWLTVKGHIDVAHLGRVTRLGSDVFAFPLTEHGQRLFVLVEEKEFPALADPALWKPGLLATVLKERPPELRAATLAFLDGEHGFTGVVDIPGSGTQKSGVVEYRGSKLKLSQLCAGCSEPPRVLKTNDTPTGRTLPIVGIAVALLFAYGAFAAAAKKKKN
jgi:hypothetical protein